MDRELLAPFLALVVLANVAGIAFVMSGRRWSLRSVSPALERPPGADGRIRLRLADRPVPTAAAWEWVLAEASDRHARLGYPATVVALRLVRAGISDGDGAEVAVLRRRLVRLTLRAVTRASDPLAWDGGDTFAVLLRGADAAAAAAYVARARDRLKPWTSGASAPVQLAIGCVSPSVGADLQGALDGAELRLTADRSVALLRSMPA
jgi:hypothetical protein